MRLFFFICLLLCVQSSWSQEFCTHWVSYPFANDSSEVLFSHTYVIQQRPRQAAISFASSGEVKVFVNERNITEDIVFCNPDTSTITIKTYDITRFLHTGDNTLAVWYAPAIGAVPSKQLSLEYYGYDDKGRFFYDKADGRWKCTELKGSSTKGNKESFNSLNYDNNWKSPEYDKRKWLYPLGAYAHTKASAVSVNNYPTTHRRLCQVLTPTYSYEDESGIHYDFGKEFTGTVRITLREAHKGTQLFIGDFSYVCNGNLDEQAFRRFTTEKTRWVTVRGDRHFKPSFITHVEALIYE